MDDYASRPHQALLGLTPARCRAVGTGDTTASPFGQVTTTRIEGGTMRFKSSKKVQPELVAAKDASRPVLSLVHLNAEQSVVEVTDSYMLARFPVDLTPGDTTGPIPVDALKAYRKPPNKHRDVEIALNGTAEVRQIAGDVTDDPYVTFPRESAEYTFPDCARLIPENLSDFEIGIDAGLLYKLAKAMGNERVRIRFTSAPVRPGVENPSVDQPGPSNMRPYVVRPIDATDDDAIGILMPIRIS